VRQFSGCVHEHVRADPLCAEHAAEWRQGMEDGQVICLACEFAVGELAHGGCPHRLIREEPICATIER